MWPAASCDMGAGTVEVITNSGLAGDLVDATSAMRRWIDLCDRMAQPIRGFNSCAFNHRSRPQMGLTMKA
jgi:hypothetical protein